jgi:ATP-binding cassette subfamily B protein
MLRDKLNRFGKNTKVFRRYVRKYKKYYLGGLAALLLVDIFDIMHPFVLGHGIDQIQKGVSFKELALIALLYVVIGIIKSVGKYYWRLNLASSSFRAATDIRREFFEHLTKLTGKFFGRARSGDLMSLATNDINSVRMMLGPGLLILCDAIIYLAIVPGVLIFKSPKLALYTFVTLPLIPFIMYKMSGLIHKRWGIVQEQFANVTTIVHENISGIRVNKSFNTQEFEIKKLTDSSQLYKEKLISYSLINSIYRPVIEFCFELAIVILVAFGGLLVVKGEVTLGLFVTFMSLVNRLTWPMVALGWVSSMYNRALASNQRIEKVTSLEPEIKDISSKDFKLEKVKGDVEFKNFTYSYEGDEHPSLKSINLKIEAGTTVGIVGEVGSGKSTLVNMISRMHEIPSNCIYLDSKDIRDYPCELLRKNVAFVPQDVFLFSDSIKKNIIYGNQDLADENIKDFAVKVDIHDEIMGFSHGYDTELGEKGINLSGGQKQRLSIARAMAVNAPVTIFDDSFSSIDTNVEEKILSSLRPFMKDRTTIIVTHRVSTLKYADRIISMAAGKIIEDGSPEELIASGGYFSRLSKLQREDA